MWHSLILILKKSKINTNRLIRSDLAKIWRLKAGKAAPLIGVQGKSIGGFWDWYHQKKWTGVPQNLTRRCLKYAPVD